MSRLGPIGLTQLLTDIKTWLASKGLAATAKQVRNDPAAGSTANLVYSKMATNDFFRIQTGGAANAGYAEIATGDDYNEPIYIRQYQGEFATLKRTATILDGSGNTSFPGTVTASGFSGKIASDISGSYVQAVTAGGAVVTQNTTAFGSVWNAPTKSYRVGCGTFPSTNELVYLAYSVTNDNVTAGTNTVAKQLTWDASNGTLTANAFSGNASSATQFSANTTVALTGDATGTSAGSKKGWSVPVTLANSGVTAGTYGPSADVTGNNNATISVPQITVDAKGRVTSVVNRTLTCKNNTYSVYNKTLTIQKNGTNVATFTSNSNTDVTANITVPTKTSELTNDSGFLTSHQDLSLYPYKVHSYSSYGNGRWPYKDLGDTTTYPNGFNEIVTTGKYQVRFTSSTPNSPYTVTSTANDGILEIEGISSAGSVSSYQRIVQRFYKFNSAHIVYFRAASYHDGQWNWSSSWTVYGDIVTHNASEFLTSHQSLSNYVTLNGTQTITGAKTFQANGSIINVKSTGQEKGVKPSSNLHNFINFVDKNGTQMGYISRYQDKNGYSCIQINASNLFKDQALATDGSNTGVTLTIGLSTKGVAYWQAPMGSWESIYPHSERVSTITLGTATNKWNQVFAGEYHAYNANAFMANYNGYTFLIRNDGGSTYFLMSAQNGDEGTWTTARPLTIDNATGVCSINGNAATATQFSANKSVALTGDVTGSASSKAGWSVATTLANSGVTAGSYGPSAAASPAHGGTFSVPYVTVDAKGRVTAASTITITLPADSNTDTLMTQNVSTTNATYPVLLCPTANATANQGAKTGIFAKSVKVNPSTNVISASGFSGPLTGNVTGNCSGSSGSCTGNAATATTLKTARKINGVSFNGSADITVADSTKLPLAGGTVTGATYFTVDYYRKDTGAVKGTAPSTNRWQNGVRFVDNNNIAFGGIERGYLSDRTNRINMIVYKGTTTDTSDNAQIGVGFDKDGNWFTYAPTPATADNSTKIATTAFVKAQGYLTSHQSLSNYSTLANTVKSLSISGKTITVTPGSGSAYTLTTQDTVYTHPTTSGNKHIPSGGSSGQFLGWDSDGTAKWVNNPNTNTDTLMTQNVSTTNATYPVLLCPTANATANQGAKTGIFAKSVKVNPSTNVISASGFSGNLTGNVTGNCSGTSANVTGTVAIANGGTGATTRLNAVKALTNENVGTAATCFLGITNYWGKAGYISVADARTVLEIPTFAFQKFVWDDDINVSSMAQSSEWEQITGGFKYTANVSLKAGQLTWIYVYLITSNDLIKITISNGYILSGKNCVDGGKNSIKADTTTYGSVLTQTVCGSSRLNCLFYPYNSTVTLTMTYTLQNHAGGENPTLSGKVLIKQ